VACCGLGLRAPPRLCGVPPAVALTESLTLIVLLSVAIPAIGYLVKKVIVPGTRGFIRMVDDLKYLPVLEQIAEQFSGGTGKSLQEAVARIEAGAAEALLAASAAREAAEQFAAANRQAAERFAAENRAGIQALQIAVGTIKELAEGDRAVVLAQGQQLLDIIRSGVRTEASGARQELSGERVEAAGERSKAAADAVAMHLAEAQQRADEVAATEAPGTAADAASQSPDEE
jgi:hypothetical protein